MTHQTVERVKRRNAKGEWVTVERIVYRDYDPNTDPIPDYLEDDPDYMV